MNLLDVHAIISIWDEKLLKLKLFINLDCFTTITKQVLTAYYKSFILGPMCIFVCEVPARSSCLSVLSVCISVLPNVYPRINTNYNKDFI